ncbi:MAG: tRNA (adenosine(37)-N6)-threonylcarbamoyltransferase complex dimerization subunit type 1 TsaB [Planctomycetota bacterium]
MIVGEAGPLLAIETSSRRATVALAAGTFRTETALARERAHASDLVPAIDRLCRSAGLPAGAPLRGGAVLVGTGPGSYTGLRVGIATALGIVRGAGAALRGVPSFEVLAFAALAPGEEGVIVGNARAAAFYYARYRREADDVVTLAPPSVRAAGEIRALLAPEETILADEAVAAAAALPPELARRVRTELWPRAGSLLILGGRRLRALGAQTPADVQPLYLRPFGG